jgi:hypothetical protein
MIHILIGIRHWTKQIECRKVDGFSFVELKENQKLKSPNPPFQISGTEKFTVEKKYTYIWNLTHTK